MMDYKEFQDLEKRIKKDKLKEVANIHQTYFMWKEHGGVCPKCGKELLEILDSGTDKTVDNFKNHGRRAHIISRNETKVRPRMYDLYSDETLKKLNIKRSKNKLIPKKYINNKNNMILLCHEDHLYFDKKRKISSIRDHEESAKEMISLKKINVNPINSFNLKISSDLTWKSTLDILEGSINEINEQNEKKQNIKIIFQAIKEGQKYSHVENQAKTEYRNYKKEKEIINSINNEVYNLNDYKNFFNNIGKLISKYFKNNKREKTNNIELFLFSFQFIKDVGIEIIIETKKKRENNIDPPTSHKELNQNIEKEFKEIVSSNSKNGWVLNSAVPMDQMKKRKDYNRLKSLLIESLFQFSKNDTISNMDSFSVAYMARWGTGKTTLVRSLINEIGKYFRYVEINLWHIANTISDSKLSEDNPFIRNIVKEALTQMAGNPEVVRNYLDATKHINVDETEADLSKKVINDALSLPTNTNRVDIIQERNKFIDQYLHTLSNFINRLFEKDVKPIIIVFDDLDRITDNQNIISILDALVAFLNIKNCIFIIPVDESKVVKALYDKKAGIDPNTFINKYFNYQIKAPFIPKLERLSAFEEVANQSEIQITEEYKKYAVNLINPTYRDIKDFINNLNNNISLFSGSLIDDQIVKELKLPRERLMVAATILQQNFPLYTDFLADEIGRRTILQQKFKNNQLRTIRNYILKIDEKSKINDENWENGRVNVNDDISFWSSILGENIDSQYIDKLENFIDRFQQKNEKEKWRQKLLDVTNKLIELDDEIKISDMNDTELLSLWAIITQAEIKTKEAKTYAEVSTFHHALSQNDYKSFVKTLSTVKSIDLINKYFENIENIKNKRIIRDVEYKEALNNATKYVKNIGEFKPNEIVEDDGEINDKIFKKLFKYNIDRVYIPEEDEDKFLNFLLTNQKIKNIFSFNVNEIKNLKEAEKFSKKIQITRIIMLARDNDQNYFDDLFSKDKKEGLVLSRYEEEDIDNLIELLNKFLKLNISQVKMFFKIAKYKNKIDSYIKKINVSEFEDIKVVNESNFPSNLIKEKVARIEKISSEESLPKDEYIDLYFGFFKDKKQLIERLDEKQIVTSLEVQKYISENLTKHFDLIKENYYILGNSDEIVKAIDKSKIKNMINTSNKKDLLYEVINSSEHLLKLVLQLAKEGTNFDEFWKIKNNLFQQAYISKHKINNDSNLIHGLEIDPNVLSLGEKLNLSEDGSPWTFKGNLFNSKEECELLHKFTKKRGESNFNNSLIFKEIINFLYKKGYEDMYFQDDEKEMQNHFSKLSKDRYDNGVGYFFQEINDFFNAYKEEYNKNKKRLQELKIKENYDNFEQLLELLKNWDNKILELKNLFNNFNIDIPLEINADNFNIQKKRISNKKINLTKNLNKKVEILNNLLDHITKINEFVYDRILEFKDTQITSMDIFEGEEKKLENQITEKKSFLKKQIAYLEELNLEIKERSKILNIDKSKCTKITEAKKVNVDLKKTIEEEKLNIEKYLKNYNEENHYKDNIKAKNLLKKANIKKKNKIT